MWYHRRPNAGQMQSYTKRVGSFVNNHFQMKYTRYVFTLALVSAAVFMLPLLYFSNQNYNLFIKLSDILNPELTRYILKEQLQMHLFFGFTFIAYTAFWFTLGQKITAKISGPAKVLRNHMRQFCHGDYTLSTIQIREDDEFKELINTYNYFIQLLKTQKERDLQTLRTVLSTITNPVAHELISALIAEREQKISQNTQAAQSKAKPTIFLNGVEPSVTPDSRRAS
jgi:hypothetical protein